LKASKDISAINLLLYKWAVVWYRKGEQPCVRWWLEQYGYWERKMERKLISFYIDREQAEKLNKLSAKTKVSGAICIRKGLALVLKKHEKQLKAMRTKETGDT